MAVLRRVEREKKEVGVEVVVVGEVGAGVGVGEEKSPEEERRDRADSI